MRGKRHALREISRLVLGLLAVGSGWIVYQLPSEPGGLTGSVRAGMPNSGVEHPVTAVLLNFRAYDTWLELGVLFLAMLGVLCVRRQAHLDRICPSGESNSVLEWLVRFLTPILVLSAGYLLWIGNWTSGGAFQAGVMLGAAGVLLWLAGYRSVTLLPAWVWKTSLILGVLAFGLVGVAALWAGSALLQYPPRWAGSLILLIETAAAISIGVVLASLYVGLQAAPATAVDVDDELR
jgi:multisubunit Na+/H+ antiporter MnhB subunit